MDFQFTSGELYAEADTPPPPPQVLEKLVSERFAPALFEIRFSTQSDPGGQQLVQSLRGLKDGWFGEGSLAPNSSVLADLEGALSQVIVTAPPTTEVDTDGTVALVWQQGENSFALTFVGNGQVIGSVFPQSSEQQPWALPASNAQEIAARLVERRVAVRIS